ncbi:hypothetical protein UA08_07724 [Talaromyces atroroseus]|uniref:Nucleoside phosphorylase domain-containing protein n=1 Tax=Talaromyces atroroseus TaxID=1441469 RepID=A0A225AML8_TALAT|nr:hypothetical protein UA08_07724 [Talaromyces atroroseus]OKL56829.1 hypothetical protein UA08_07724 [Talaromyces atroroseus]
MTTYNITQKQTREDVHIGIVCTLDVEKQAIDKIFDETYNAADFGKLIGDANYYKLGRIGRHNVVLVKLSGKGTQYSARSVTDLSHTYRGIKLYLLVGVCAGVPFRERGQDEKLETAETIFGDVIIGDSIVQTDNGKQLPNEYKRRTGRREVLGNPPLDIRNMLSHLRSEAEPLHETMMHNLRFIQKQDQGKWEYKDVSQDRLFEASVRHKHYAQHITCECVYCKTQDDPVCPASLQDPCSITGCAEHLIQRTRLNADVDNPSFVPEPLIHFGTVASANTVMKSGEHRDYIVGRERNRCDENIIAFEMEGAGMWDDRPCVIIKGVSDYANSHKNDIWHAYAAATAASCTRAFLEMWIPSDPLQGQRPQWGQSVGQCRQHQESNRVSNQEVSNQEVTVTLSQVTLVEQNTSKATSDVHPRLFYILTKHHFRPRANGYWNRLTLESWNVYRSVYRMCYDEKDRKVRFQEFLKEFDKSTGPSQAIIREYWNRVIPKAHRKEGTTPPLSQGLVLAVLYMLHILHTLHESPPSEFDDRRHAFLSRFAYWTSCCCNLNCGRSWNFVSYTGIWRRMPGTNGGPCHGDMHLNHNFRDTDHIAAYKSTFHSWWNAYVSQRKAVVS